MTGDLSSIRQVNQLTDDIKNILDRHYEGRLDVLMNVAGMVSSGKHLNEDGNEITFAVNHLAVFLLTQNLIPREVRRSSRFSRKFAITLSCTH